jgi:hypothetical protein
LAEDSQCTGNLLRNGTFSEGLKVVGNGSMPPSAVDGWATASRDPQVVSARGCETPGYVAMWGNKVVGEAIRQTLTHPLEVGKTYRLTACVRYANPSPAGPVRLKARASRGALPSYTASSAVIGVTAPVSSMNWVQVTLPDWTASAGNLDTITLSVENEFAVNDGAKTSWAHVDNVCLQAADEPAAITYKSVAECEKAVGKGRCACSDSKEGLCSAAKQVFW